MVNRSTIFRSGFNVLTIPLVTTQSMGMILAIRIISMHGWSQETLEKFMPEQGIWDSLDELRQLVLMEVILVSTKIFYF